MAKLALAKGARTGAERDLTRMFVHDLRSPLAAIAMNLDFALSELPAGEPEVAAALTDARDAVGRTLRIVSDMVTVCAFDAGTLEPERDDVDLFAALERVVSRVAAEAHNRGVELIYSGDAAPMVIDADLVVGALERVVLRAVRVAEPDTRVVLKLSDESDHVQIEVFVDGPLVPAEQREAPFARPTLDGRGRADLALYLARAAAEAHGGTVAIGRAEGFASTLTLTFPRDRAIPSGLRRRR